MVSVQRRGHEGRSTSSLRSRLAKCFFDVFWSFSLDKCSLNFQMRKRFDSLGFFPNFPVHRVQQCSIFEAPGERGGVQSRGRGARRFLFRLTDTLRFTRKASVEACNRLERSSRTSTETVRCVKRAYLDVVASANDVTFVARSRISVRPIAIGRWIKCHVYLCAQFG